ncbi:hypothetical protein TRFO_37898 [Tritrichomonas foetus]|uniref:RING-type domain-containing protein n=1 Tax=Tritrichomonas foetus TaxID=1144522 RepID=A0A1J4JCH1_9EUKA|nr:hypothetical protein TRFO_37898 [Tritrichomonas foetus]|eukprot:OHS95959.1 hypothetical protein TRFO_37898 [Tritrichomonas foetus]
MQRGNTKGSITPTLLLNCCAEPEEDSPNKLEILPNAHVTDAIFLRQEYFLHSKLQEGVTARLSWLTISQCTVTAENIHFQCKLQVTARGKLIANNCSFEPYSQRCECAVEIFANSKGELNSCEILNGIKTGVAVRDRSEATFKNCRFHDNTNTAVLVLDNARVNVYDCIFEQTKRFSIYLYKYSIALLKNCKFLKQDGKAIFMLNGGSSQIFDSLFEECGSGSLSLADESKAYVSNCTFKNISSSSVHAMKASHVEVNDCKFFAGNGNGVNFEYSGGYVNNCEFHEFKYPAIACFGPLATPVIYNSKIIKNNSIAVVSRDCAKPLFTKVLIESTKSHAFSISDLSEACIDSCIIKDVEGSPFCAFNGALPTVKNTEIFTNTGNLFEVFTQGQVRFFCNKIHSDDIRTNVHHFGVMKADEFRYNYLFKNDDPEGKKPFLLQVNDENTIQMSEADHIVTFEEYLIEEEKKKNNQKGKDNKKEQKDNFDPTFGEAVEENGEEEEDEDEYDEENEEQQAKLKFHRVVQPNGVIFLDPHPKPNSEIVRHTPSFTLTTIGDDASGSTGGRLQSQDPNNTTPSETETNAIARPSQSPNPPTPETQSFKPVTPNVPQFIQRQPSQHLQPEQQQLPTSQTIVQRSPLQTNNNVNNNANTNVNNNANTNVNNNANTNANNNVNNNTPGDAIVGRMDSLRQTQLFSQNNGQPCRISRPEPSQYIHSNQNVSTRQALADTQRCTQVDMTRVTPPVSYQPGLSPLQGSQLSQTYQFRSQLAVRPAFMALSGPDKLEDIPRPDYIPKALEAVDPIKPNPKHEIKCKCSKLGTCMRCNEDPAEYICAPCGHKVLCKKCADAAENPQSGQEHENEESLLKKKTCPLCETPIQKCTEEYTETECVICLENECDTIILPCGHRCICYECASQLWTEKKNCPLCQSKLFSFRRAFPIFSNSSDDCNDDHDDCSDKEKDKDQQKDKDKDKGNEREKIEKSQIPENA